MSSVGHERSFPRTVRLLTAADYDQVFNQTMFKVHQSGFLMLAGLSHPRLSYARLGLIVAKRKVRYAHDRNRIKRVARASFSGTQMELPAVDLVIIAKAGAQSLSRDELHDQLSLAWQQVGQRYAKQTLFTESRP